jgi:TPR repeat protein
VKLNAQFAVLTIAMAAAIPAQCLAAPNAQVEAALKFLDATDFDGRLKAAHSLKRMGVPLFDLMYEQQMQSPDFQAMQKRAIEMTPKLRQALAEIYGEKFSEAELATLTRFFRTPAGRRYVKLLPELELSTSRLVFQNIVISSDSIMSAALDAAKQQQEKEKSERVNLEERAERGDREAMFLLGNSYCYSFTSQDDRKERIAKCFDWKKRAAEAGLREAQIDIGFSYIDGRYGNGKSPSEMIRWMTLAAEQGDTSAQFYVGSAYAGNSGVFNNQPTGVEINGLEAARWFEKAAIGGHMVATIELAGMYLEGKIIKRNETQAMYWYAQGAAKGNRFAMGKLGQIFENGMGIEPNVVEALRWYKQAAGVPVQ